MDRNKRSLSEIQSLSNIILNKILKDKEIRKKLAILIKNGSLTKDSILLFSTGERIMNDLFGDIKLPVKKYQPNLSIVEPRSPQIGKINTDDTREHIDGRELSENEISFQEWVSDQFNEDEWLKRLGLRW